MKNLKYLFVIALAFFMIYMPVNADQNVGSCNRENCSMKIERVNENDALVIDPEILTLEEGEILYAISVLPAYSGYQGNFAFSISIYDDFDIMDVVVGYVPSALIGDPNKKQTSYNVLSIDQRMGYNLKADVDNIIGYLIVKEEYENVEFYVEMAEDYSNREFSEVVLNGIKYDDDDDHEAINTDILFGDFKYNYVIVDSDSEEEYGYWEAVNNNSNKIVVDNSNSISSVYSKFSFIGNSGIGMTFNIYEPMAGDVSGPPESDPNRSYTFEINAGKKETIIAQLFGGNPDVAREILKADGQIGFISLFITNNTDQL